MSERAMMTETRWNAFASVKPRQGSTVEVMYADGVQCRAKYVGGLIFYPVGSDMYRYVNVLLWRDF